MLGEPKRKGGGVAGVIVNLYAVELLQADVCERYFGRAEFAQSLPYTDFKLAYSFIRHDKEIAAAASRVEEFYLAEPCQQAAQALYVFSVFSNRLLRVQPV